MTSKSTRWRALVDISLGVLGYYGIPQDSRLMYQALSELPDVDACGLIFSTTNTALPFRGWRRQPEAKRIDYQARLLQRLVIGQQNDSRWQAAMALASHGFGYIPKTYRLDKINREWFGDVVWRQWLEKSLESNRRALGHQACYVSSFNRVQLGLRTALGLTRVSVDTRGFDAVIFQEARAIRVSKGTVKIVRHHDLIPLTSPDLIASPWQIRVHAAGVRRCAADSIFVCDSTAAQEELLAYVPECRQRVTAIPCIVPRAYYPEREPKRLVDVLAKQCSNGELIEQLATQPYLIMTGTIEPRKNHMRVIEALARIRIDGVRPGLILVGNNGWKEQPILQAIDHYRQHSPMVHLRQVSLEDMRLLYSCAQGCVFPSYCEGFGYPPLEAMSCGCPVLVSDIATHRSVYGDAASYCDPYSTDSIERGIRERLLGLSVEKRQTLVERGIERAASFRLERVKEQWQRLFVCLQRQRAGVNLQNVDLSEIDG